eukprot:Skav202952  [mRNA]  locus=scaffold2274:60:872:+ [translate_table: standard]
MRQDLSRTLVDPLTWHSFRVFIPDCAFQLGVPRTQRQYLGNWLTESTADVYTREKRNVVVSIWKQVANKVPSLNLQAGRERREDLNHPDWDDTKTKVMNLEEDEEDLDGEGASGPGGQVGVSPSTGPDSASSKEWQKVTPPVAPRVLFEDDDTSLRIVYSDCRSFQLTTYRIHLLNDEGQAVGCGWRPKSGKVQDLKKEDFIRERDLYGKCVRCFKNHSLPMSWTLDTDSILDAPGDSDSSVSSGSDTDDSVDTESENEGVHLPVGHALS